MFKVLQYYQRFQPGAHLWGLFFEPERLLFKQINWRMGFLLQAINSKTTVSKPLLMDTQKFFPNVSLICLPFHRESWSLEMYDIWKRLNRPSFRVFMPLKGSVKQLNEWPKADLLYNLTYYQEIKK